MDILAPRPAAAPSATTLGRPENDPIRQTVATELPTTQSVSSAPSSFRARPNGDSRAEEDMARNRAQMERMTDTIRENLERKISLDKDSGEWVYRSVNARTKETVYQYPDDVSLKMRAYRREVEAHQPAEQPKAQEHVERRA